MDSSNDIQPIWNRIPQFFTYGLKFSPLCLTGIAASLSLVPDIPVIGLILLVVSLALPYKYCFTALEYTAEGDLNPPELSYKVLFEQYEIPFKQLCVFILFGIIIFQVARFAGEIPALVLFYSGIFLLPASVMVMGMTHDFLSAINPVLMTKMVRRIGWSYLALLGFLFMLTIAEANLQGFVYQQTSGKTLIFLLRAVSIYFSIVMFHMMGYLLFQFHEELGESAPRQESAKGSEEDEGIVSELFEKFMAEGNTVAALAELESEVADSPDNAVLHRRFHTMLMMHGEPKQIIRHGKKYISLLISSGNSYDGADVYLDCIGKVLACPLEQQKDYLPLMKVLREKGRRQEALGLVKEFSERYPESDYLPQISMLSAQILCEDLGHDDEAKKVLDQILKTHPRHELATSVKEYRNMIANLSLP
ncbi:MAG: hypothetical protein ABFS45_16930 [Pseudomonadota bacterium]